MILALSFCMLSMSVSVTRADSSPPKDGENCLPCTIDENSLDGVKIEKKVYDENGNLESFSAVVPLPEGELPVKEGRGIITAIVSIIVGAYKACKVTSISTGGFNPCTYLAAALGRKIVNGVIQWYDSDKGSWNVSRTSHSEKIPGCEPMYSSGCIRWYYTYNYSRR